MENLLEIIKYIWNLKWWQIFIIAAIDDIFLLLRAWFIWTGLFIIGVFIFFIIKRK